MNTISQTYIDALLADAAYVNVTLGMTVAELEFALSARMTPTLAAYIAANVEVVSMRNESDIPLIGSGFDATVWRIKAGSELAGSNNENAGKTYVSMRGTEPFFGAGADLLVADTGLALGSAATSAIIDMVNWWLRETTPNTELAKQIKWDPLYQPDPNSVAIVPTYVIDTDSTLYGTGHLADVTGVQIDGHSMGGHMASAFARIFGAGNSAKGSVYAKGIAAAGAATVTMHSIAACAYSTVATGQFGSDVLCQIGGLACRASAPGHLRARGRYAGSTPRCRRHHLRGQARNVATATAAQKSFA